MLNLSAQKLTRRQRRKLAQSAPTAPPVVSEPARDPVAFGLACFAVIVIVSGVVAR